VHERALIAGLIGTVEEVAAANAAPRVTRVSVRLGALSHFTVDHFREHFADAARGTVAEGAAVDAVQDDDITDPRASDVVLESVEVETSAPAESRS
jgi:hydrogenase nickel incorporation protein HypA/HybF